MNILVLEILISLPKTMAFSSYQISQKKALTTLNIIYGWESLKQNGPARESTHTLLKCSSGSYSLGDFMINTSLGTELLSQEKKKTVFAQSTQTLLLWCHPLLFVAEGPFLFLKNYTEIVFTSMHCYFTWCEFSRKTKKGSTAVAWDLLELKAVQNYYWNAWKENKTIKNYSQVAVNIWSILAL